ncbi:MAG: hypothetical protein LBL26_11925 [Peptococcaceae bacterium]|jgi:hypothetical protein|nr:hypothetical protein [Peptococcaceae bacterium]
MIYRAATPADGPEMLRLMESYPAGGRPAGKGIQILYTRRPDAYQSYVTECPGAEIILCAGGGARVLAQIVCLPRKLYIGGEARTVGYVAGLRKEDGVRISILKMLETGYAQTSVKQLFCSILDDHRAAYDLFAKRGWIRPICGYSTYFLHPAALKRPKHGYRFRRAVSGDTDRLLAFYQTVGSGYSYFPAFVTMNDFPGLTVSDFFLLEDGGEIAAAGALWDQRAYKQCVALGYYGIYRFAAHCNPLLRLLRYPPLPKTNTAACFAYISFLLDRQDHPDAARVLLGELASAARGYDFLTVGAVKGDALGTWLDAVRSVKIGSRLCLIDYEKTGAAPVYTTPPRFECALL